MLLNEYITGHMSQVMILYSAVWLNGLLLSRVRTALSCQWVDVDSTSWRWLRVDSRPIRSSVPSRGLYLDGLGGCTWVLSSGFFQQAKGFFTKAGNYVV